MTLPTIGNAARVLANAPGAPHLGPATVVASAGAGLRVELANGAQVDATLALQLPYDAHQGDVVLTVGNADGYYVIGVISTTGKTTLAVDGDLELRSNTGAITVAGKRGVTIAGEEVALRSNKLDVLADAVTERLGSLHKTIRGLFALRSGEVQTLVRGNVHQQSERATILTEDKVCINGREVHLG